jgi:hypothetical protein
MMFEPFIRFMARILVPASEIREIDSIAAQNWIPLHWGEETVYFIYFKYDLKMQ